MIRKGEIDTLHALGNHSGVGGVDRVTIRTAARLLMEDGLHFPIWTNHGDDKNLYNIRAGSGDDSGSAAYIADLLPGLGVTFLWLGDLTPFVGQNRRLGLWDTYLNKRLHPSVFSRMTGPIRYLAK